MATASLADTCTSSGIVIATTGVFNSTENTITTQVGADHGFVTILADTSYQLDEFARDDFNEVECITERTSLVIKVENSYYDYY